MSGTSHLHNTVATDIGATTMTMKRGTVLEDFTVEGKLDALIDTKEDINTSKNVYASTFDGTSVHVYNTTSTIVKTTTISHPEEGKDVVAGKFRFQEDIHADQDVHVKGAVYGDTLVATNEVSGKLVNADIKLTTKDVSAQGEVSTNTLVAQAGITGKDLTVTNKTTTKDLKVNGSLEFSGKFKPRSIHHRSGLNVWKTSDPHKRKQDHHL